MIGQTVSHYRIIKKLGEGGMGVVYLAEDTVLGRQVAVKTLTETGERARKGFRGRFLREARSASTLSHPHIATIYDYGETPEGQPYIVMELVKGDMLGELMLREKLTIQRSLKIVSEVAAALAEAHRHGIIHRDIKPSNIAINQRGEVKVLDFGLAKQLDIESLDPSDPDRQTLLNTQTREGVIVGTPMYLSPEQALGAEVDARSDIFSLGGVLYECIAGRPPFVGSNIIEICAMVIRDDPPAPSKFNRDVPSQLDRITLKTLQKKPEQRYQNGDELVEDLNRLRIQLQNQSDPAVSRFVTSSGPARHTSALATLSDIFQRPRLSIGYVAAGLVLLTLLALGVRWMILPKPHVPTSESQQLLTIGVEAVHEGTFERASRLLQRAVQKDPEYAMAHVRLAEAWTELDLEDRAKDELLSVTDLERSALNDSERLYLEAITATVKRDFTRAINLYEQLVKLDPNDASVYFDLGRAYEKNEQPDAAITSFEQVTKRKPESAAAYVRLGVLYFRKLDKQSALSALDQAEKLYRDAGNFEGNAEVLLERGTLLMRRGELVPARTALEKALEIARLADSKSQQVRAMLQLSNLSYSEGNTTAAKKMAGEALEMARSNEMENLATEGLLDLGYALFVGRAYAEAEQYFRQALDISERNKSRRNQARSLLSLAALDIQQERPDSGLATLSRALEFYRAGGYGKEISQCLFWTARAQIERAEFDEALKTLDEQLQIAKAVDDPAQLARSQEELSSALGKLEFYPQALARYTESYESFKMLGNGFHVAFCLINRADMLARLGHYDEAIGALDELSPLLTALPPDNSYRTIWSAFSSLIRAQVYLSQEKFEEARTHANDALKAIANAKRDALGNTESAIKEMLGTIALNSGSSAAGVKLSQEALAAVTESAEHEYADSHAALADALLANGDAENALKHALTALEGFSARHRSESEWKTLTIAARASSSLGDSKKSAEQYAHAEQVLASISSRWGEEAYRTYSTRKDIQRFLNMLAMKK